MFALRWTPGGRRQYEELQANPQACGLFSQVRKALRLLADNPRHPGLRTHAYHSLPNPFEAKAKVFEAYAQNRTPGAYRIFWCYGPGKDEITIIAITPHP